MTKRKMITLSVYDEDIQRLEAVAMECGMTKSDVIRELIEKASVDKYCREIITKNSFNKTAKKRLLGKTSHNVHYENTEISEKNPTSHPVGEESRCPNESPFHNDTLPNGWTEEEAVKIARMHIWGDAI